MQTHIQTHTQAQSQVHQADMFSVPGDDPPPSIRQQPVLPASRATQKLALSLVTAPLPVPSPHQSASPCFCHPFEQIVDTLLRLPHAKFCLPDDYPENRLIPFGHHAFDCDFEPGARLLAKAMLDLAQIDLGLLDDGELNQQPPPVVDLFGEVTVLNAQGRLISALIWLFDLDLVPSFFSFNWACDLLDYDPLRLRQLAADRFPLQLVDTLRVIARFNGAAHAQQCEDSLTQYVTAQKIDAWKNI